MMFDCKNCQHKVDGDCPCTSPGKCDFTEKKAVAEVVKPFDAMSAWELLLDHFAKNNWRLNEDICLLIFQQYAESYHAKKCAECKHEYSLSKKCTRLDNANGCHARNGDVCMNMFQCPEVTKCK